MAKWHKTKDREEAYRNMINMWLTADPENMKVCRQIIVQNKERRSLTHNSFGASKENPKDIRLGLSLPPGLYYVLQGLERMHKKEFMTTKEDLWWFARRFPQFTIAERI